MAQFDIMPHKSPLGGTMLTHGFRPTAASTFEQGDPVEIIAAGTVSEGTTPIIVADGFAGICAGRALDTDGVTLRTQVEIWDPKDVLFISRNFATDGAGTLATPAQANIGDGFGLVSVGGSWRVDTGTATNIGRIIDVLDARGRSVAQSGAAGVFVVVQFNVGQLENSVADA
jgi:hypothetical protein